MAPTLSTLRKQLMDKHFPAPRLTPCPRGYFHKSEVYQAARKNGDLSRFGQRTTVCLPPKNATAQEKARACQPQSGPCPDSAKQASARKLWEDLANQPFERKRRAPKKKTPVQLALDAVFAAFTHGFPDGVSAPLTEENSQAIDQALAHLNTFYEESRYPTKGKGKSNADIARSAVSLTKGKGKEAGAAAPSTGKGKEKAVNQGSTSSSSTERTRAKFLKDEEAYIQSDEYDSDIYDIDPSERLLGTIIAFTAANQPPLSQDVRLRSKSNFRMAYFNIAKVICAVPDDANDEGECVPFVRFSLSTLKWTSDRVLGTLNLTGRGNIMLYRAEGVQVHECPGIDTYINRACASAYPDGWSEDEEETEHEGNDLPSPLAAATPSTSFTGTPSTSRTSLKRKIKIFSDEEIRQWEEDDRKYQKQLKFTREPEEDEVILVEDSDEDSYAELYEEEDNLGEDED